MRNLSIIGMEPIDVRPGGLNRYANDLVEAYKKDGVTVNFVSHVQGNDPAGNVVKRQFRYFAAGLKDRNRVVDSHFAFYALPYMLGRWVCGRKFMLVSHFQGPWAEESAVADGRKSISTLIKRRIESFVYDRSSVLIVLSEGFKDKLVTDYGVKREDVRVIKPGVDLTKFTPGGGEDSAPRNGQVIRLCAVRRLDPRMGLDVAIQAMSLLGSGYSLTIAGVGKDEKRLRDLIDRLSLDNVQLVGRLSDAEVVNLYRQSDLSIVPTLSLEGFGLVVLESLACGTPVVASRQGGLVDALENFRSDMLFEAGNARQLADAITKAAKTDAPTSKECRTFAELHSWKRVVEQHHEVVLKTALSVTGKAYSKYPTGTMALVVCTVNRPNDLQNTLASIQEFSRLPDEIIVVTRRDQTATLAIVEKMAETNLPIRTAYVDVPGLAAAVQTGLACSKSEITCFTDDDAIPFPNWMERIERRFKLDPFVVAVGGRDNVDGDRATVTDLPVGQVSWSGRIHGNHALGVGAARYVSHLKGVNVGYWTAIAENVPLKEHVAGEGAQYRNELMLCLAVGGGLRGVVYDSGIQVDHFPAQRGKDDARTPITPKELKLDVTNELSSLLGYGAGIRPATAAVRTIAVGTRARPGLLRLALPGPRTVRERFQAVAALASATQIGLQRSVKIRASSRRGTRNTDMAHKSC